MNIDIGKDVPVVWGNAKLVWWNIHGIFTTAKFSMSGDYLTVEDAIRSYPEVFSKEYLVDIIKNKEYGTETIKRQLLNLPIITPVYEFEEALVNPYIVGWDFAILPLTFIKTEDKCKSFNGRFYEGVCIRNFTESDQITWLKEDGFLPIKEKILEIVV